MRTCNFPQIMRMDYKRDMQFSSLCLVPTMLLSVLPLVVLSLSCQLDLLDLRQLNTCRAETDWRTLDVHVCLGLVGVAYIWIVLDKKKV